jgi:hypothetical protein
MIYAQIWTDDCISRPDQAMFKTLLGSQGLPLPHVVNKEFVGQDMALEVVEAYYRAVCNRAFDINTPLSISDMIYADRFDVGLYPANILTRMNIDLLLDDLTLEDQHGYMPMDKIKWCMQPLHDVIRKRKSGFKLSITLSQRHIRLNVLEEFINMLRPILVAYHKENGEISILWSYYAHDVDNTEDDESDIKFGRNIQDAFQQLIERPGSTWKADMIKCLDEVSTTRSEQLT